jgi:hypothetical protein
MNILLVFDLLTVSRQTQKRTVDRLTELGFNVVAMAVHSLSPPVQVFRLDEEHLNPPPEELEKFIATAREKQND